MANDNVRALSQRSDDLPPAILDAIEAKAQARAEYERKAGRLEALLALHATGPRHDAEAAASSPLLSREALAKSLSVSVATIDRDGRRGMPFVRVGASKRFDLAAVLAWMASRGEQPPQTRTVDPDVSRVAAAAGLRVVGGR